MNYKYYPGCTIKTSAQNYEHSAMAALQCLGAGLEEMEQWNCCGVVHSLTSDDLFHQVAPIRVLMNVEHDGTEETQHGGDPRDSHDPHANQVVTLCDMCYNTLSQANEFVKADPEKLKTINTFNDMDPDYHGGTKVSHLLQVLRDEIGFAAIKKRVKHPLKGLNVFPYYGCMLLRPAEVKIDDAEDPKIMADLMRALGAEVVDDPMKIECCGSHLTVGDRDIVYNRVERIISRAQERGANAVVLSCPLCRFNLDTRQAEYSARAGVGAPLPVFYYTQLMCLAFGVQETDEAALGLSDHRVDPRSLLQELGLLQEVYL
jgi:heterodisulfide reductase subunit B